MGAMRAACGGGVAGSIAGIAGGVVVWWADDREDWDKWRRTGGNGRTRVWQFLGMVR